MKANVRMVLMLGVDVPGKTLEEALAHARDLKWSDLVQIKRGVDHNDSTTKVTGVDTGEWTE